MFLHAEAEDEARLRIEQAFQKRSLADERVARNVVLEAQIRRLKTFLRHVAAMTPEAVKRLAEGGEPF